MKSIDEAATWLRYDVDVSYIEDDHVVRHKPLAGVIATRQSKLDFTSVVTPVLTDNTVVPSLISTDNAGQDRVQRISAPSCTIVLSGVAARFAYRINPPRIEGPGIVQMTQNLQEKQIGSFNGVPVWALSWRIVYLVTKPPAAIPVMANPGLLTSGTIAPDIGKNEFPSPIRTAPKVGDSDPFVNMPMPIRNPGR